jgi:putative membrane protein
MVDGTPSVNDANIADKLGGFMTRQSLSKKIFVLSLAFLVPAALGKAAETKSSTAKLSSDDTNFIKEAFQGGLMEVQLGNLAQEKAADSKVKEFGKRLEQDHAKANDELKQIASAKGVQLSNDLDSKHKSKVDKLAKVSGADFDKRFMDAMVSDHKEDIKKFERVSEKAKDADLKKFASQTLPTLKEHLKLAESTAQQVKAPSKK